MSTADDATPTRPRASTAARISGLIGELLITLGVLVLLFVSWQVWWVTKEATAASQQVVGDLTHRFAAASPAPTTGPPGPPGPPYTRLTSKGVAVGAPFGLVTVPRFGTGPQPVIQGNAIAQLDKGIGHEPTSVMPGQVGNFATAGHRDTYSHPYSDIDRLAQGDAVVVEVEDGWAIYRVVRTRIVEATALEVYAPVPDQPGVAPTEAWMTMTACEPRWTATRRWAAYAKLEAWVPRTAQQPTPEKAPQVAAALQPPATAGAR